MTCPGCAAQGRFEASRYNYYSNWNSRRDFHVLKVYEGGTYFGEKALLQNVPRAASVTCVTAGRLWALERLTFRKLLVGEEIAQAATGRVPLDEEIHDEEDEPTTEESEPSAITASTPTGKLPATGKLPPLVGAMASPDAKAHEATAAVPSPDVMADGADGAADAARVDKEDKTLPGGPQAHSPMAATRERRRVSLHWEVMRGVQLVDVTYETVEEKQARKLLRRNHTLHKIFEDMWNAADTHLMRLTQEGYMNYHVGISGGSNAILRSSLLVSIVPCTDPARMSAVRVPMCSSPDSCRLVVLCSRSLVKPTSLMWLTHLTQPLTIGSAIPTMVPCRASIRMPSLTPCSSWWT